MKPVIPIHVGVSGHRDIPSHDIPLLKKKLCERFVTLKKQYPYSSIKLLSGLAEGADRIAAYAALESGLELVVVLPMPVESYMDDFITTDSKDEFNQLLAKSTAQHTCQHTATDRNVGYVNLGHFLVRHSQLIIALWDGVSEQPSPDGSMTILPGGTADVVRMSEQGVKANHDVLLTAPEKTPVEHLWARRLKHDQFETPIVQSNLVGTWSATRSMPKKAYSVMQEMDDFNCHVATELTSQQIDESRASLLSNSAPEHIKQNFSYILDTYAAADALAIVRQKQRKWSIYWITLVALISIFCQQVYSGPDMRWPWLAGHVVLAMVAWYAFGLFFKGRMPREEQFIEWRVLAEGLRVQFFWCAGGVKLIASDYFRTNRLNEVDWITQTIRNLMISKTDQLLQPDMLWVKKVWVDSQSDYFKHASPQNIQKVKIWNTVAFICFGSAILMTFVTLVAHLFSVDGFYLNIMVLVSGMLFVISALSKAFMSQMGFEENAQRYERAEAIFTYAKLQMEQSIATDNISRTSELLKTLGWEALYENAAWLHMNRTNKFEVNIA